jgi:hypothetical protein
MPLLIRPSSLIVVRFAVRFVSADGRSATTRTDLAVQQCQVGTRIRTSCNCSSRGNAGEPATNFAASNRRSRDRRCQCPRSRSARRIGRSSVTRSGTLPQPIRLPPLTGGASDATPDRARQRAPGPGRHTRATGGVTRLTAPTHLPARSCAAAAAPFPHHGRRPARGSCSRDPRSSRSCCRRRPAPASCAACRRTRR